MANKTSPFRGKNKLISDDHNLLPFKLDSSLDSSLFLLSRYLLFIANVVVVFVVVLAVEHLNCLRSDLSVGVYCVLDGAKLLLYCNSISSKSF